MTDLVVLQTVRLKGRARREDVDGDVDALVASGLLLDGPMIRLSPEGRTRLAELLAAERSSADAAALAAVHGEFRSVNVEFKALVTDWQLRGGQPNTHDDPDYDAAVLARLDEVHRRVTPLVDSAAAELPRLGRYSEKLQAALDRVHAGDTMWLSRPLIDSYHTVWFELHEELILAAGLTREGEDA
ncbi:MarR family transcriptional regulator [Candidatus Mycobacterium wuenschmannii]|uniref:MarR family transcriptional regulator n=1 Tax=Candidatus Mycobacterium wuenschmannii TaxID=3027808 RepID=A0ABY8W2B0_9MYCO|nr:MarR family transcriptional regulator [Candidatus Mycobacterium wuenschmannii]WIM90004.1 MarR family transcriptional regulator [Candidatus Mycobacterium wuenschmannii]